MENHTTRSFIVFPVFVRCWRRVKCISRIVCDQEFFLYDDHVSTWLRLHWTVSWTFVYSIQQWMCTTEALYKPYISETILCLALKLPPLSPPACRSLVWLRLIFLLSESSTYCSLCSSQNAWLFVVFSDHMDYFGSLFNPAISVSQSVSLTLTSSSGFHCWCEFFTISLSPQSIFLIQIWHLAFWNISKTWNTWTNASAIHRNTWVFRRCRNNHTFFKHE